MRYNLRRNLITVIVNTDFDVLFFADALNLHFAVAVMYCIGQNIQYSVGELLLITDCPCRLMQPFDYDPALFFLKRNTDSVKCAMENDVFGSLPDDSLLDELEA